MNQRHRTPYERIHRLPIPTPRNQTAQHGSKASDSKHRPSGFEPLLAIQQCSPIWPEGHTHHRFRRRILSRQFVLFRIVSWTRCGPDPRARLRSHGESHGSLIRGDAPSAIGTLSPRSSRTSAGSMPHPNDQRAGAVASCDTSRSPNAWSPKDPCWTLSTRSSNGSGRFTPTSPHRNITRCWSPWIGRPGAGHDPVRRRRDGRRVRGIRPHAWADGVLDAVHGGGCLAAVLRPLPRGRRRWPSGHLR